MKKLLESLKISQKNTQQSPELKEEVKAVEHLRDVLTSLLRNLTLYIQEKGEQLVKDEASFGRSFHKFSVVSEPKDESKAPSSTRGSESSDSSQPTQNPSATSSTASGTSPRRGSESGSTSSNAVNPPSGTGPTASTATTTSSVAIATTPTTSNTSTVTSDNVSSNASVANNTSLEKSTSTESGFLMAMDKFAEVIKDISEIKREFIKETTQKLVQPLTAFIKLDLSMLKDLKKKYEKASLEYSQILAKIESLQSHKKLDIVKLYSAEKERVRLKKIFDEATEALQTHCDDVQDRLGFDFLEWMISFMRAQKTMFGFVYGELQEIKEYLDELHAWCKEEAFIFQEHKKERDQLQAQALETEHLEHIKQFLKLIDIDVLDAVKTVGTQKGINILPSLSALYAHYHVSPVPDGLPTPPSPPTNTPESDLQTVQEFFKTNFDGIALTLLVKNKRDHLIELGEALSQLERPSFTSHAEEKE